MKAMIFAAGRGDRMRPLTDTCPKPLLPVGGKPLIVWQIEALARAGLTDIVINHAWLGAQIEATLGDGARHGVRIAYSAEGTALETAGGIARALPLLADGAESASTPWGGPAGGTAGRTAGGTAGRTAGRTGEMSAGMSAGTSVGDTAGDIFLAVSGDIFCDYDYRALLPRAEAMRGADRPRMHLVMVPNPPFHPRGDFLLDGAGRLHLPDGAAAGEPMTFGNIGLYDTRLFRDIEPGQKVPMTPYYRAAIAAGSATGERFGGRWENVGTPAQLAALDAALRG